MTFWNEKEAKRLFEILLIYDVQLKNQTLKILKI